MSNKCPYCLVTDDKHRVGCPLNPATTLMTYFYSTSTNSVPLGEPSSGPTVAERVTADLQAILDSSDFDDGIAAEPEMPRPERDLTTYADAFESARKACKHDNAENVRYAREWYCHDCLRVLGRRDLGRQWWMYG